MADQLSGKSAVTSSKNNLNEKSKTYLIIALVGFLATCSGLFLLINTSGQYPLSIQADKYQILETRRIRLNSGEQKFDLSVEIADSKEEQSRGLMFREFVGEDDGMLFIFPTAQNLNFWMKNTYVPLDILFFDQNKKLINIQKNTTPFREQPGYPSNGPAQYALEVRGGTSDRLNLGSDTTFEFVQ